MEWNALLISAIPLLTHADAAISLNNGDFIAAETVSQDGETIIKIKLSKSGKAKFKKLNESSVNKEIHAEVAGVVSDFKLREPIKGDNLQMGPYSAAEAQKIVAEINK